MFLHFSEHPLEMWTQFLLVCVAFKVSNYNLLTLILLSVIVQTYNENDSFHAGQRFDRTIFVLSFALPLDSGTSLTLT